MEMINIGLRQNYVPDVLMEAISDLHESKKNLSHER